VECRSEEPPSNAAALESISHGHTQLEPAISCWNEADMADDLRSGRAAHEGNEALVVRMIRSAEHAGLSRADATAASQEAGMARLWRQSTVEGGQPVTIRRSDTADQDIVEVATIHILSQTAVSRYSECQAA
jgi:hypothetical protein